MAFEIWLDTPKTTPGNTTIPVPSNQQLPVNGHYIDDDSTFDERTALPVTVSMQSGANTPLTATPTLDTTVTPNPDSNGYVWWVATLSPVTANPNYTITATLAGAVDTTSDSHEHIAVTATTPPINLPAPPPPSPIPAPPRGMARVNEVIEEATIVSVAIDVGDTSGTGTWVICMLRKGPNMKPKPKAKDVKVAKRGKRPCHTHTEDYLIFAVQALRVTGRHLTATFTVPKTIHEGRPVIAQAMLLNDAGQSLGQSSQYYPT